MQRIGNWIATYSGQRFYPLDPRPDEVYIQDIAHSLSMTVRFRGHIPFFYTVAEHSIRVSHVCEILAKKLALHEQDIHLCKYYGALHDAAEAYCADVPGPLKHNLTEWTAIEHSIDKAIFARFELVYPIPASFCYIVKAADALLLVSEMSEFFENHPGKESAVLSVTKKLSNLGLTYSSELLRDTIISDLTPSRAKTLMINLFS